MPKDKRQYVETQASELYRHFGSEARSVAHALLVRVGQLIGVEVSRQTEVTSPRPVVADRPDPEEADLKPEERFGTKT